MLSTLTSGGLLSRTGNFYGWSWVARSSWRQTTRSTRANRYGCGRQPQRQKETDYRKSSL